MPIERRIYWDSDVFISLLQQEPKRIAVLRQIVDRAERGELRIIASTFTLCEVAKIQGVPLEEDQERLILDFFENDYILIQGVDLAVAKISRQIVREHKIPGRDAIHIASAIQAGAQLMQSYDERHMLRLDGKIGDPPLRIEKPRWKNDQALLLPDDAPGDDTDQVVP